MTSQDLCHAVGIIPWANRVRAHVIDWLDEDAVADGTQLQG